MDKVNAGIIGKINYRNGSEMASNGLLTGPLITFCQHCTVKSRIKNLDITIARIFTIGYAMTL